MLFCFGSRADLSCKSCSRLVTGWLCNSNTIVFQEGRLQHRVVLKLLCVLLSVRCASAHPLHCAIQFNLPFFFLSSKKTMTGTKVFCLPESLSSPEELVCSFQTAQRQIYFYSMSKMERRGAGRRGERRNKSLIGPWFFRVDWEKCRIYSCVAFAPATHLPASLRHHVTRLASQSSLSVDCWLTD